MKKIYTDEQIAIIDTDGDLKVNAVAGSGKTTTLLGYAASRKEGKTLLYVVFNKSAKEDALSKFMKAGLRNTTVQTAHSLAYQKIMTLPMYRLLHKGYNTHEAMVMLNITGADKYILSAHVCRYLSIYCNSNLEEMDDLDYLECMQGLEEETSTFVKEHLGEIILKSKLYWTMLETAQIEVTHEFYLKKYQLSHPKLKYDYILFDEGQDASPVMLDIFLGQDCIKVIVGDTHQQIYAWRGAVNSLEQVNFPHLKLTRSFRFGEHLAGLAKNILFDKDAEDVEIIGVAKYENMNINSEATISRTNICLLQAMINYIKKYPDSPIFFEGNVTSLIYTESGISIYDVINLDKLNHGRIYSKFLKTFTNIKAAEDYCKKAHDRELLIMIKMVHMFGYGLGKILETVKSKCTHNKDDAEMVFTTTHKAKGLEFDQVTLTEDFTTIDPEDKNRKEEINILYVAATRAKKKLVLPEALETYRPQEAGVSVETPDFIDPDDQERMEYQDGELESQNNFDKATQKLVNKVTKL